MLELKAVTKVYKTAGFSQKALNNVSLSFAKNGFVSILGPSGSGKTTLLNIIGGLDHYTSGDLIIEGVSTKRFKDSDWDSYRNHRIGFVFQSYNLISHQTILSNVRLALTLSGISKREGLRRAKEALRSVGLGDHIHKHPAELSGGQMQRVAIARALVNDPDILLADEPTGALDSETSVQIMELLKSISKQKLVVMVTHNPDLANQYSTRIINLKDGQITKDTAVAPAKAHSKTKPTSAHKSKKTKMSFLTALSLSLNNLLTKKGRTILVAFAGSIGIIGIALIMAVSTGFQNYVDSIEADALTSYPLIVAEESFSLANLMQTTDESTQSGRDLVERAKIRDAEGKDLVEIPVLANTLRSVAKNDLKSFKRHYESHAKELENDVKTVSVGYSVEPNVYAYDQSGKLARLNPSDAFSSIMGSSSDLVSSFTGGSTSLYSPITTDEATLNTQYDVLAGRWPKSYDEVIINLSVKGTMTDLLAYNLGLKDTAELKSLVTKLMSGESVQVADNTLTLDYSDLLALDLRVIVPSDLYVYNDKYDVYEDMSGEDAFLKDVFAAKSIKLKVVGIITSKEGVNTMALDQGVNYLPELVDVIIARAAESSVVKKQLPSPELDVFSGQRFDEEKARFDYGFEDLVSVDEAKLANIFKVDIDQVALASEVSAAMVDIAAAIDINVEPAATAFSEAYSSIATLFADKIASHDSQNPEATFPSLDAEATETFISEFLMEYNPGEIFSNLEEGFAVPSDVFRETFYGTLSSLVEGYKAVAPYGVEFTSVAEGAKSTALYATLEDTLSKAMTEAKIKKSVLEQVGQLTSTISASFAKSFNIDASAFASAFTLNFSEDELMRVMESLLTKTESTQKSNLISLGYQDKEEPTSLWFYFTSFDGKENFLNFIEKYNESVDKDQQINYSDMTGILMDSVKVIVNAVSIVLIAFVSISLVVSSIMIGIITYISVYERTKEIGILRALGASKRNISSIFNAETFIIGFLSGLFGITIAYLLIIPINAILHALTNVANLSAALAPTSAVGLIVLSVVLTLIGGLIPARTASKKDPVVALRTE